MTTIFNAGEIHMENGDILPALWEIPKLWEAGDKIIICDPAGHPVVKLTDKEFRAALTAYCESTPKLNDTDNSDK